MPAVTLTWNVQDPDAVRVAPESDTVPLPAVAVIVPPPQDPLSPLGVATVRPEGSVSVNATPVSELALLGLLIVKLRLVDAFTPMLEAPNAFAIDGGETTVRLAVAVLPVPPFVELTALVVLE